MLRYDKLRRDRRKFLALTGLTPKEFQGLLPGFARASDRVYPAHQTQAGEPRQRKPGGGRKGSLASSEQKLLLALLYQKLYPVQTLLGEVFALSQSRANRWIHRLLPVLKDALDDLGMLPERAPRRFARHEKPKQEAREFIIDGTERRRQRPQNPEKQALHYRGKKKTHSDKNVVVAHARTKRVGYLSQTYAGKTHDKKITDQEPIVYPRGTTLHKDTGFQGYEPRGCRTHQPKKSRAKAS
jgi:Helix-turn-helix of DDE superfamily endonuclease/DDE superfamily endonuclease